MDEATKSVVLQSSPEERYLLGRYLARHAAHTDASRTALVTIGQAIQEEGGTGAKRTRPREDAGVGHDAFSHRWAYRSPRHYRRSPTVDSTLCDYVNRCIGRRA